MVGRLFSFWGFAFSLVLRHVYTEVSERYKVGHSDLSEEEQDEISREMNKLI